MSEHDVSELMVAYSRAGPFPLSVVLARRHWGGDELVRLDAGQ